MTTRDVIYREKRKRRPRVLDVRLSKSERRRQLKHYDVEAGAIYYIMVQTISTILKNKNRRIIVLTSENSNPTPAASHNIRAR